ncbi:hypothetical protein AB0J65_22385, partial [Streptomyces toxytricini]
MNVWLAIALTAAGCYAVKLAGLLVPAGALERPLVRRLAGLLPVALPEPHGEFQPRQPDGAQLLTLGHPGGAGPRGRL